MGLRSFDILLSDFEVRIHFYSFQWMLLEHVGYLFPGDAQPLCQFTKLQFIPFPDSTTYSQLISKLRAKPGTSGEKQAVSSLPERR